MISFQMMNKIQSNINRINGFYKEVIRVEQCLTRMNRFMTAYEVQKGIIEKTQNDNESDVAINLKGSFSWGINSIDKQ